MKRFLLITTIFISGIGLLSAQKITTKEIQKVQETYHKTNPTGLHNILSSDNDLRSKALNRELQGSIDHIFKYRVSVSGITDQKSSGRCWMFTSLNVLRPVVMEKYNLPSFDFSQNYLYFWDIFEKANLFLENVIATSNRRMDDRDVVFYFQSPVSDGGVWNLFYNLGEKYGMVPQSVMPETAHSNNTSQMLSLINERLRKGGYALRDNVGKKRNTLEEMKWETLSDVYRILALCLGEPPVSFSWRAKDNEGKIVELTNYTPQQFYEEIVPEDYNPASFIMVMNDPTRDYYQLYEIANYRNTIEGVNWVYLNLPNEEIKQSALASVKNNEALYASCDVGKQFNRTEGILDPEMYNYNDLFGVDFSMDKKARILTRQSGSSHAMTIVGVDTDANDKPLKWEFENSWGAGSGHNGYLTFTDRWFEEYLFRLVVNKRYLSDKAKAALSGTPVQLPAWDYMF